MIKPELLMPAGNIEKLKYAIKYGADAVLKCKLNFIIFTPYTYIIPKILCKCKCGKGTSKPRKVGFEVL